MSYHERKTLADGTELGKMGSLWYILDDDGNQKSDGYHEITVITDGYRGNLGASNYILDEDGERVTDGYHEVHREGNGFYARSGAVEYSLDEDGNERVDPIDRVAETVDRATTQYNGQTARNLTGPTRGRQTLIIVLLVLILLVLLL